MSNHHYSHKGFCPICEDRVTFYAANSWFRDSLFCPACPGRSIPRERALMQVLRQEFPAWKTSAIHESSPVARGVSVILSRQVKNYIATQFYPSESPGKLINGFRNENLEKQTFEDECFDLVISLDVMEHVNYPDRVLREVTRTLRSNGAYIFTTPTYKGKTVTERRALYKDTGDIEYLAEPEYHGNPVSEKGSLVTFHYGYDLPELIKEWCGMDVKVERFCDEYHGIIGEFTEVYVCRKR